MIDYRSAIVILAKLVLEIIHAQTIADKSTVVTIGVTSGEEVGVNGAQL
jgi:hypothetical protein